MRSGEFIADLLPYRNTFLEWDRSFREPFCQGLAFHEFQNKEAHTAGFLKVMNRGDVGMVQRRDDSRPPPKAAQPVRIAREFFGQDLNRNIPFQAESRARYTSPIPPFPTN